MKTIFLAFALLAGVAGSGQAAEIRVISAGAVREVMTELGQGYQAETGHTVRMEFGPVGVVRRKLATEPADVVILSDTALDQAIQQGSVVVGSRTDIGRTAIGIAVKEGARSPDISTPDALKQALLATRSLTYSDPAQGATSGIHIASVLEKLGITD